MPIQFPSRDLTDQYISLSYQDVVQTYTQGTASYFLDGLGNAIGFIPSASLGQQILTADSPSPPSISSSYAFTASVALNVVGTSESSSWASQSYSSDVAISASWASHSYTSEIATAALTSVFADTASLALESTFADTASIASFANFAGSASYSISSSHANNTDTASLSNTSLTALSADFAAMSATSVTSSYARNSNTASYISKSVNTTFPLQGGGDLNNNPNISIPQADSTTSGYLSKDDWTLFNNRASTNFSIAMAIAL